MQSLLTGNFVRFSRVFAVVLCTFPALAESPKVDTHLALGDSITFGMNPLQYAPGLPIPSPAGFAGYPEVIADRLRLNKHKSLNAGCPGETSASFLDIAALDNGCNSPHWEPGFVLPPFKPTVGLHVAYSGSQGDYAVRVLRTNKKVDLVTLSVGANDLLLVAAQCAAAADFASCAQQLLVTVLPAYGENLGRILRRIRVDGGYRGKVVLLKLYSPNTDPLWLQSIGALNGVMEQVGTAFGATFADGFGAFLQAAASFQGDPCAAGLLVRLGPGVCDSHPSSLGQQVLAGAILADPTIR